MLKVRIPEIFLSALLAVAIFLVGVISSQISSQSTQSPSANNAADKNNKRLPNEGLWHWLTKFR
jgi:hypothetical protein